MLYAPELDHRLLSTPAQSETGLHVTFCNKMCAIRNGEEVVTQVTQKGKLLILECDILESANVSQEVGGGAKAVSRSVWHARLVHIADERNEFP